MSTINIKPAVGMLLVGSMVGATIALLYAPQSGDRTKKDIKKVARKAVNRLDDIHADVRDNVADWIDDMTQLIQDGVDRGKKLGTEGYAQVLQGFDNAKKCVEDGRSRFAELIKTV